MGQFDVCRLRKSDQLVIVLQHDVSDELGTRVVAPLSDRPFRKLMARLRVPVELDSHQYVVHLDRLAAIHKAEIGPVIYTLATIDQLLKGGLDLLFFGI